MKNPLYRKVNSRARNARHNTGGDYRHIRNTKREIYADFTYGSMNSKYRRGLDYTPLFQFLLSKVGSVWNDVYSEAVSRLDRPDPIFWIVAIYESQKKDYVRIGESSYYSGLYVDDKGLLQRVNPELKPEHLKALCKCCTHTFNGVRLRYEAQ